MPKKAQLPDPWITEIVIDTERHIQSEMQQDQRGALVLTTSFKAPIQKIFS